MKSSIRFITLISIFFVSFTVSAQLFENFENGTKTSYTPSPVTLETGIWYFSDALLGTLANDKKNGFKSVRFQNSGYIEMSFDYPNGMLELSFYAANYGETTGGSLQVSYSVDGGSSWEALGSQVTLTGTLTEYTLSASIEGNVRVRFTKTSGDRINVDDVRIVDYIETVDEPSLALQVNGISFENGETFDFGINTGQATATLTLRNTGAQDLVIESYELVGDEFSLSGSLNITLTSLQTHSFSIIFSSNDPGIKNGSLSIFSNDPNNAEFVLNLTAERLNTGEPIPIAIARNLPQGSVITVTGWLTAASQFRGPVYFQDETGAIAWYDNGIMRENWLLDAIIGDSIVVTGELGSFNSLLQIINATSYEVFHESNREVEPIEISLAQLNSGEYEAWLVKISDLEFVSSGVFSGGNNYQVSDPTGTGQVRIDSYTNINGTIIPNGIAEVTGIAGRYQSLHQLLPRFTNDIVDLSGPIIITIPPYEISATENSITFQWETEMAGHSEIRYGISSTLEMGQVVDEEPKTNHTLTISNLSPATAYKVQLRSAVDTDTSTTALYIASTKSPAGTTGEIFTFFNKDVVHNLATYREADQNVNFSQKLIQYIQQAENTADFAFYSISGDVGSAIADAIIAAHNRGVDVRVIATGHTGVPNSIISYLVNAGVKAVQSLGVEQMHNKFAVFDAYHSNPSKTWIITSSWNATNEGTYSQYQNMVAVQDVALARAYWLEFNQMWGGSSGNFNAATAKFGPYKTVVNPSVFWIGDDNTKVEAYFSPQANTETKIISALNTAESNIDLTLNLITRSTISTAMHNKFDQGVKVRGSIGVVTGTGAQFDYLSIWADVHHFSQAEFGLLHHKYAIIDGEFTSQNSKVITGSHNWSANANFNNDENILIIHNPRVANEYFQEFAARYWQAGGEDVFNPTVFVDRIESDIKENKLFLQNYPNPFNRHTTIRFNLFTNQRVTLSVYDLLGRRVATIINNEMLDIGDHNVDFDGAYLAGGLYIYRLKLESGMSISKSMLIAR